MAKVDVHAERAARLVEALRQQRDQGANYPLTATRLRELVEPELNDDDLFKALSHRSQAGNLVVLAKKDPASPVALAEDASRLAAGDLALGYALNKLATPEKPLHPVPRIVSRVDKSLQPAFEAALNERLQAGNLPEGVGKQESKGKVQLYLEKFPPPAPPPPKKAPAAELAERLLAALQARHDQGERIVNLGDLAGADVKPAVLKKAVEEESFCARAVVVPVGKTMTLAALAEDRAALLGSDALLRGLLQTRTTAKKPLAALADLAAALPEGQRDEFVATWAPRLETNALPAGVLLRDGQLCLEVNLPATLVLSEKVLAGLERRRQAGEDYPTTLDAVVRAEAPDTPADLVAMLAADRSFRSKVVQAVPGNLHAPLALAGDEERLAGSPLLIEFAVRLVSTPEQPGHPVNKVAGSLDKSLRKPFEQAVARLAESGSLPAGVASHDVKGKLHLRRAEYPPPLPPRPAAEVLAEKLLAALRAARQAGPDYPLPLARLVEQADPEAPERLVKSALAHGSFNCCALTALPGKRDSLVALNEDRDRLAGDPRLLEQALAGTRTADNQAVPLADLGKKLAPDLRPIFTTAVEKDVAAGTLPAGVGALTIKKKPHLFLLADLAARPAATPPPAAAAAPPPEAPPAEKPLVDFARMFDEVFERLGQASHGQVSLVDLRRHVPVERDQFDEGLNRLRRAGRYSLEGAEGRHGISPEEREAGIVEHGRLLLYVSRHES